MRPKPKGMRRLSREEILAQARRLVREGAFRYIGLDEHGNPVQINRGRCYYCNATVKSGHNRGCIVSELLWNIDFELWLSKPPA